MAPLKCISGVLRSPRIISSEIRYIRMELYGDGLKPIRFLVQHIHRWEHSVDVNPSGPRSTAANLIVLGCS
jgi:hypothetical protein